MWLCFRAHSLINHILTCTSRYCIALKSHIYLHCWRHWGHWMILSRLIKKFTHSFCCARDWTWVLHRTVEHADFWNFFVRILTWTRKESLVWIVQADHQPGLKGVALIPQHRSLFFSRWRPLQRSTADQNAENKWLWMPNPNWCICDITPTS